MTKKTNEVNSERFNMDCGLCNINPKIETIKNTPTLESHKYEFALKY